MKAVGVMNASDHKRGGNVVGRCPLGPWSHKAGISSEFTFGTKIEHGDPPCNCFACGYKGTLGTLLQRVIGENKLNPSGLDYDFKTAMDLLVEAEEDDPEIDFDAIPDIEENLAANKNAMHLFPEAWLSTFPLAIHVPLGRAYLKKRGVGLAVAKDLDLRFDPSQGRVCFPVRDFAGKLRGLHGRAISAQTDPRYRMYLHDKRNNPLVWLGESWVDLDKPIVVVEGPFDVASVLRVYPNVVSPLFASPSDAKLKRMMDALEWVTLLDRGTGGDEGRQRVEKLFGKTHVINHAMPPEHRKDPGEMTPEEIINAIHQWLPSFDFGN